jgi:hypothetical protein
MVKAEPEYAAVPRDLPGFPRGRMPMIDPIRNPDSEKTGNFFPYIACQTHTSGDKKQWR